MCVLGEERGGGCSAPGSCLDIDLQHGWGARLELGAR